MMLRRTLLAASLAIPFVTARAADRITLRIAGSPPAYQPMFNTLKQLFEARNPDVALSFDALASSFEDLTQQVMRTALVGDMPDVVLNGSNQVHVLARQGLVVPLGDRLAATPAVSGLDPDALAMGKVADTTVAIPLGYAVPVLFFNGDLVRRAGGDPDALPTTWDGVMDLAGRIRALDPRTIGAFIEADSYGNWTYLALLEGRGGRMMSADDRTIAFDGPEGVWALKMFRRFGMAGQAQSDMSQAMARGGFTAGGIGILASSSTVLPNFERQVGDRFPLRMAPFPVTAGVGRLPGGGFVGMLLTKDRARQEAAWRFLTFLTSAEAQAAIVQFSGWVPVSGAQSVDPSTPLGQYAEAHKLYASLLRSLPAMTGWYSFPGENANKITVTIRERLQSVVRLTQTPEQAMAQMAVEVKALLPA